MTDLAARLDRLGAEHDRAARRAAEEREALAQAEREVDTARQAQAILQEVAEGVQNDAVARLAGVVTRCLRAVFGEDEAYEFKIRFLRKRGKTEAELLLERDGLEVSPLDAAGGGVCDVTSFALRLVCLVLARPQRRKLLIMDEPWKHLSAEYRPAVRRLVQELAREMGVQFLIVTHSAAFRIGKVIELGG